MPEMPEKLRHNDMEARRFMGVCYADRCLMDFVRKMKDEYPDSLFVVTGDHAAAVLPYDKGILPRSGQTLCAFPPTIWTWSAGMWRIRGF